MDNHNVLDMAGFTNPFQTDTTFFSVSQALHGDHDTSGTNAHSNLDMTKQLETPDMSRNNSGQSLSEHQDVSSFFSAISYALGDTLDPQALTMTTEQSLSPTQMENNPSLFSDETFDRRHSLSSRSQELGEPVDQNDEFEATTGEKPPKRKRAPSNQTSRSSSEGPPRKLSQAAEEIKKRNRVAATKCRLKKKALSDELHRKADMVVHERNSLSVQVMSLQDELCKLWIYLRPEQREEYQRVKGQALPQGVMMGPHGPQPYGVFMHNQAPMHMMAGPQAYYPLSAGGPMPPPGMATVLGPAPAQHSMEMLDISMRCASIMGPAPAHPSMQPALLGYMQAVDDQGAVHAKLEEVGNVGYQPRHFGE